MEADLGQGRPERRAAGKEVSSLWTVALAQVLGKGKMY